MASLVGLTLVKRFPYRGDTTEEYSNTYHFTGAIPASNAAWKTLADALIVQEKTLYPNATTVVRAYGYSDDAEDAASVWSYDYLGAGAAVNGTLSLTGGNQAPGDAAVWVRWRTSRNNTNGKPIYLRKYFHPAVIGASSDAILAAQKTNLDAFGTKMWDGSFLDARTIRSRSTADTILSSIGSTYITTRTLKRRGKRPGS